MANYRYLFADLVTNTITAELPLTGVTYSQSLNQAGSFTGHMMLSDIRTQGTLGTYQVNEDFTLDSDTTPSKTAVYVERDGVIVWGGIIWSRQYESASQTLTLGGREFESYYERRRVNGDQVFAAGTDQFTLVSSLISQSNTLPYGNIGVSVQSPLGSSATIVNPYPIWDNEKRAVFDVILDLSRQSTPYGFDFSINCAYDTNYNITKTLNLYYPRKGTNPSANQYAPMLEFPGSMVAYTYPEDGGSVVNRLYGVGPGSGPGQYIALATNGDAYTNGYPVLEDTVSFTQIPDPRIVDSMTSGEVAARALPVTVLNASWVPTTDPTTGYSVAPIFGEFQTGDSFRIRITDDRFPNTLETVLRLREWSCRVGDNGQAEMITGSFVIATY